MATHVKSITSESILQKNLSYLRASFGLSLSELAERLSDIQKSDLASWETRCNPPIKHLITLSDYFQVSIDDLVRKDLQKYRSAKKSASTKKKDS